MTNLINKEENDRIYSICKKYNIIGYSVNVDGTLDVYASVALVWQTFTKIPLRFGKVSGDFYCYTNALTSLDGAPVTVDGGFNCSNNKLTSLVGSPNEVGGDYKCSHNNLTSLIGSPSIVRGDYISTNTDIICTYSGDIDIEVTGDIFLGQNKLPQSLKDNIEHIKLILKYQRHFYIWNEDLTLNEDNFKELLDEIKDGLE